MGLMQKKDERDEIDGIQVIGRGEGPDGLETVAYDLVAGESAEDIAAGTTDAQATQAAMDAMAADAADEALMDGIESDASDDDKDDTPYLEEDAMDKEPQAKKDAPAKKVGANHGKTYIALTVALVIVAGVAGYFVGHGGIGGQGVGSATLAEDQLDSTVASWSYNGASHNVSAKEAIETQYSLDNAKDDDGNYATPSTETIVSYVRNQILVADAESRGITVSSKEMKEFAENQLGTSDYEQMAKSYGVTKAQAKQIVKENAILNKLYDQVTGSSTVAVPTEPTEPADGNEATASKDYADYIINLAGDEWDTEKGTWASTDGKYYEALKDEQFTADSATYAQAQKAYSVAYSDYTTAATKASSTWSSYVNELYAKANVHLYGLYV